MASKIDNILHRLANNCYRDTTRRGSAKNPSIHEAKQALLKAMLEAQPEPTTALDGNEAQIFIIATDRYSAAIKELFGGSDGR